MKNKGNKENDSKYDRFQSNQKHGLKSPQISDSRSFMTGQKNQSTAQRHHLAITDRKRETSNTKPFGNN